MKYVFKNGKYIIEKDGVYFAVTHEQVPELYGILIEIQIDISLSKGDSVFGAFVTDKNL